MTKINKAAARKLFSKHKEFWIVPCNLRPEYGVLIGATGHTYDEIESGFKNTFDKLVNQFEYYNCNNETGRYSAFYLP